MAMSAHSFKAMAWRIEREGEFGGYAVSGWRYAAVPAWHVKVWMQIYDQPEKTFVVAAGEFYPDAATEAERLAVLSMIASWEAEGLETPVF